ncbi:MAG: hypothetical protein AAF602_26855 [Myxococcota bacterium]
MQKKIYALAQWVQKEGDAQAFDRLRLRTLGEALDEGIFWTKVDPETRVSERFYAMARDVATDIVGKPCPL